MRHARRGFTLVELLVVITIIGMLVALLLPAVLSARGRAQITKCTNSQKELGLALLQYENAKEHYPGYVNRVAPNPAGGATPYDVSTPASWVAVLLPYLGREDVWREWRQYKGKAFDPSFSRAVWETNLGNQFRLVQLSQVICPSDSPTEGFALSYTANCGLADPPVQAVFDNMATAVLHNRFMDSPVTTSSSSIKDGTQCTLLFSENIQAGRWYDITEANVGMVWWNDANAPASAQINKGIEVGSAPENVAYARPSSNHSGGVVATFCGGNVQFVSEDIDYYVYQHLMTPDSLGAAQLLNLAAGHPLRLPLDENSY